MRGALQEIWAGWRLAVGFLTVWPVRVERVDRQVAGWAMELAPLVGLGMGALGAGVLAGGQAALNGSLLAAVAAVGVLALATRGLHLDGLADLADGLGSRKEAARALEVMRQSDVGPFGVVTLVFVLLAQVAALAELADDGPVVLVAACVTGRLAVTWACVRRVPAARDEGLGALVAGSVNTLGVMTATGITVGLTFLGMSREAGYYLVLAVLAGLAAAWAMRRHAVRRLGGITGDVLGALVETAATTVLVTAALLLT